jgi:hypothetical protein
MANSKVVRRATVLLLFAVAALTGVTLLFSMGGTEREATRDVEESLGLIDDPPFKLRLSGPLWGDRTLKSEDGAPDVAYVTRDETLDLLVTGASNAAIADVELQVDDKPQRQVRPPCAQRRCPTSLRLAFRPRLGTAVGDRRVQVIVRDPHARDPGADVGSHMSTATFAVHVGRDLPAVRGDEPVTVARAQSIRSRTRARRLSARARRVLAKERRNGVLGALLGQAHLRVRAAGQLTTNGRALGATLLLELTPARRNISATVPAYVPAAKGSSGYRTQTVQLRATLLRDLLVDVDLDRGRVIALEPGPRSQTEAWKPSQAPAPAGAEDEN